MNENINMQIAILKKEYARSKKTITLDNANKTIIKHLG